MKHIAFAAAMLVCGSAVAQTWSPPTPGRPNQGSPVTIVTGGKWVDHSGSTTATTSTQVMGANPARGIIWFQNLSDTDMYVNFTSAASNAAGSYKVTAGGFLAMEASRCSSEAMYVWCSASSKAYTAKEM